MTVAAETQSPSPTPRAPRKRASRPRTRFLSRLMSVVSSHGLDIFNAALDVVTAHSAHLRGEGEFKYFNGVVKRMVSGG